MARIRTIKPTYFRDEQLQDLENQHPELHPMLVFAGLWTVSDKDGHFPWLPRTLKLDILPFLEFDLGASLALLREANMLSQYEVDGKTYGAVINFKKHQRINGKEAQAPATFPAPPMGSAREASAKQPRSQEGNGVWRGDDNLPLSVSNASPGSIGEAPENHGTRGTLGPTMGLHPLNYATKVLEELGIPNTRANLETVAAAVKTVMAEGKSGESACEFLIAAARDARGEGIELNKFWFEDAKWRPSGKLPVKLPDTYVSVSEKIRREKQAPQVVAQ